MKLTRGYRAWTMIAHITRIFTVGDHAEAFGAGQRLKLREEFVFAEVTAIHRILEIIAVAKLVRAHHPHWKTKVPRDFEGLIQFRSEEHTSELQSRLHLV